MKTLNKILFTLLTLVASGASQAADAVASAVVSAVAPASAVVAAAAAPAAQPPLNWNAIIMFLLFVAVTLVITYWAATRTKTATDFYAAGRGVTGLQNGMAIAGDYMSAASFLGIQAARGVP